MDKVKLKKIFRVAQTVVLVILIVIGILTALSVWGPAKILGIFVVRSGSMAPTLKTGSIVFERPATNYQKGDIVTFRRNDTKEPITHRIFLIEEKDNQTIYTTKGDANEFADVVQIPQSQILGKVFFGIPYLGYVIAFARTWPGLIILIIIPAIVVIYDEINNIRKEIVKKKENDEDS